ANGNPPIGRARWGLAFGLAALVMILSLRPVGAPARSQESMGTLQMAVAMLADGRIEQADRALARATDLYPENALAWKHRLEQTARQQGTEAARALFSGVPPATREDADLRFVRGILAEASGDLVEADSAYRAAISVRGRFPEAEARLAAIWARRGEIEPAESLLTIATRAGPAPPSVFLQLATLRRQLGDVDGASDAIANAGNDRATIPTGLQAWIHLRRGETASTESALSNGKPESGPAERDRIALRMQALLVEGRAEEAEALGRSAWPLRDDGDSSTMAIRYYGTLAAIERGASTSAWQTQWSLSAADFSLLQDLLESRVGPWGAAPAPATRRALHRLRLAAPAVAEALTRLLREETGVHIDAEGAEDR
ncbi:MAG: hypothetical protein KC729_12525, partial [Candidatus Eisenbacteria bacterium]|nr:hypothetical protein [Candidatus Eisenbacteria bacterium]